MSRTTSRRGPYDEVTKKRALKIYETDGPNAAARVIGCSASAVTKWAKAAGVETLTTKKTKEATDARRALNENRFELLKERLLDEANRALDELHAPAKSFKWHNGVLLEAEIPEPTFTDKRHIAFRVNGFAAYALAIEHRTQGDDDTTQARVVEWSDAIRAEAERRVS